MINIKNIVNSEELQQLTLWFGNQDIVKNPFGVDISCHSQVRGNKGNFK